ncbi:MAG: CHAP domain-containing protein [Candidatus Nanopelagicales bacterium]|mgnify:CR=1 FL=1
MKRIAVAALVLFSTTGLLSAPAHALELNPTRLTVIDVPSVVPAGTEASVAAFVPRGTLCRVVLRDAGAGVWKGPSSKARTSFAQFPWTQPAGSNAGAWRVRVKCRNTAMRWKSTWSSFTVTSASSQGAAPVAGKPYSASVSRLASSTGWSTFGTTLIKGTDWFNGRGVDVRSNGTNGCAYGCAIRGAYGTKYQCVELVNRFVRTQGWVPSNIMGNAGQILDKAPAEAFAKHEAGDGYLPVPGDIIVWTGGSTGYGHVAVVSAVADGLVTFVEQNASRTGTWHLKMGPLGKLAGYGSLRHIGYLHAYANG